MRLTIIPSDNTVYVDRESRILDLTLCSIPDNVHALQWFGSNGWIEFSDNDGDGIKPDNENIAELPVWANNAYNVWESWVQPEVSNPNVEPTVEVTE